MSSFSHERIQELTSQYNHLRAQPDTKAIPKVIDDSFRFHDDVTDSDVTTVTSEKPRPGVLPSLTLFSQERIQELTSQYNHLRAQLDTKAILKVIDDSFRFHDDVTDSDVTTVTSETPQPGVLDMKLPSNVGKLKAFSSLPEGLDRGDMGLSKSKPDSQYLDFPIQPKVLKDQCTSPLRLSSTELSHDIPSAPVPPTHNTQTAPVPMRAPLYPKYLRRLSSGSDDSFIYSHNETISDQSDLELRIRTLKDQLNKRKLESERLKKELKSVRAENLKAKEASLLQQIRFYDKHIQVATQELENEKENGARPSQIMMKPLILKPQKKMAPKNANTAGGHLNTTNNTNTVANITNMSVNMSSLEETSDQTHSSHDYHKEPFDTESDKLDASDSTNVNKSNDSLEPSVQTITEEDHTMVDAAGETIGSNEKLESLERRTLEELEKDAIKTDISNGQITKPLAKLDRDVSETAKETDDHTKTSSSSEILEHIEQSLTKDLSKESAIKNVSEESAKDKSQPEKNIRLKAGVSLPKDEEVSELSEVSTHQSETSEIQTELESLRNEIVEEILSSARSVLEASEQTHETETETVETNRTKYDSIETAIESVRSIEADTKTHIDSVETAIESVRSIETDIKTHIDSVKTEQSTETNTTRTKHIDSIETAQSKKKDIKTPIVSVQTSIETARSLDSKTDGSESHIEDRASESDGYEEKNYESEVLQVSFREKTINETFIIHEESLSFERKPGDRVANESDVIEELSEVASSVEEDSPELKPLELSPKETAAGIKETEDRTTGTADSKKIDQLSLDAKDKVSETGLDKGGSANEHKSSPEMLLDEQEGSNSVLKITSSIEAIPPNGSGTKQSNIVESNSPNATGTKPTTILDSTNIETPLDLTDVHNTSDILSPNISDLDFLPVDKDFLRLDNYALPLINLSPSKAPETPILHALKRDYQMSRQIQLEQISNDIVKEELNASIESIVGLYNAGRENASDKARGKLVRAVSVRGEDGNEGGDKDEGGDEGKEVEEEVQDEADDSLEEKELSWTSEDDWYNEDFGLTLQGPPAIVAEVLLQKERQIDQEIEKIKQLTSNIQSLTDPIDTDPITRRKLFSGAYPYLREIPDKPPPPYIEPACSVPASEPEITGIIEAMVQSLMCPEKQIEVPSSNIARIQMYYSFLYDLTRDVYTRQTTPSTARCEDELPWQQPRVKAKLLDRKVPSDTQVITSRVVSEVCQLLALRPSPKRDNFIARWSRPKRDPVDEIIVQESKAEEPMWTGFHVEETEIKNQIADAILQDLLAETAVAFRRFTAGRSQA
ncbi:hypothetical protein M8J75_001693 [Diaphorina citri]|nr:hypothetical protein M8J75_001693 [Diaphorina citri]